jgi:hypothetical protein
MINNNKIYIILEEKIEVPDPVSLRTKIKIQVNENNKYTITK